PAHSGVGVLLRAHEKQRAESALAGEQRQSTERLHALLRHHLVSRRKALAQLILRGGDQTLAPAQHPAAGGARGRENRRLGRTARESVGGQNMSLKPPGLE